MIEFQTVNFPAGLLSEAASWLADSNKRPVGLYCPGTLTATSMTFQVTYDGTNYVNLYAVGGASVYSITVGTSRYVPLDAAVFRGVLGLKLQLGGSELATRIFILARSSVI